MPENKERGINYGDAQESARGSTAIGTRRGKEEEGKDSGRTDAVENVMRIPMTPRTLVENLIMQVSYL